MRTIILGLTLFAAACAAPTPPPQAAKDPAARCSDLASAALPQATITEAKLVAAVPGATPAQDMPAYCRVSATLTPSADSDIKMELWLPTEKWNGKFMMVGNGGATGSLARQSLPAPLRRGYAVSTTDTGHTSGPWDMSWALGHPEKVVDFGWRAVHETTVKSKALVAAYYGAPAKLSYWNACSSGGKQGLKEAQNFPEDYDGIIAAAPANNWVHLITQSTAASLATLPTTSDRYIAPTKYPLLHKAALDACDKNDGVVDGVIEDPRQCKFDPAVLACKSNKDGPTCLTKAQIGTARKIYGPVTNPRTGALIFPGLEPGSELGWALLAGGPTPFPMGASYYGNVIYGDASWKAETIDFDKDVATADRVDGGLIAATNPDLSRFKAHGGKMITYHGWSDPLISPRNSINYYESVVAAQGSTAGKDNALAETQSFYRLFMVPGQGHCAPGGPGADMFDSIAALEAWVEHGQAPEQIIATHVGAPAKSRPLCPYPTIATYKGAGDTNDAANFICTRPK